MSGSEGSEGTGGSNGLFEVVTDRLAAAAKIKPPFTIRPVSSVTRAVAQLQDTLVFVDGVLFTECCAAEIAPTHLTISVPLRPNAEAALRAAVEIRVTVSVRSDPQSPERTTLLDHVARGYKLDRVSYHVGSGERNSSFWVADVRFVKPLSAVRSSDDGIVSEEQPAKQQPTPPQKPSA